ncbi:oligopeptide ABC transporter substrate-binding protein [Sporosarcina sp. G11-34]|uniref:oligopeptide ABC transporter substrate-binding protein n=1 Tax=Sporosarcina sp. G11-34 TaxID=2849605 RepID=UPI0022A986EA|nr:oligopeptide ABC transporter substrate-binding protein [Sporosarcina sp. G11-34]MCZ2259088.1 oligopeptide ABC transporter substrate-binding protein [Sporosarcina sp. G11-34]
MKKKSLFLLFAMMLVLSAFLAACNSDDGDTKPKSDDKDTGKKEDVVKDEGPQKGGTLVYGIDAEPEGKYSSAFYQISTDKEVIDFFDEALINFDENLQPEPNLADWETEDYQHYTFKFKEGVKWHNGEELTVHDWVFALETLADKDYEGSRYTNVSNIEGAEAYRAGTADSISGLEVVSDYEIKVTFAEPRLNNLVDVWSYPLPKKAYEGIAVADMAASDVVRKNPIGVGPFKIEKIVPGESVEFVRHDDYWNGDVLLDKIILRVIDNTSTVGALGKGDIHLMTLQPVSAPDVEKLENVEVVTAPGLSYYYVGFKLGVFDNDKLEIVEEKTKYADKNLRHAMMYALNRQEWVDAFFFGYGKPVNKPVPSSHWISADDSELNTYDYDPEKAMQILDEAGYKDIDGDGFREDPNGEKFVIKFAHYATGNPTFEARSTALAQYWEEVGLQAEVDMTEVNLYYEMIEKDDPGMETFYGGWGTGTDPDPSGLWKSDVLWNYPRYNNPESDKLLEDALNVDLGDDTEKRKDIYVEWQKLINEELPMLFITELEEIVGVNENVGGFEIDVSGFNNSANWYLKAGTK